jgi:heme/copper-type cytochrome/quinol oxidase subunit 2
MHTTQQPLQSLAPSNCPTKCDTPCASSTSEGYHGSHWGQLLLWWLIIAVIVWIILYAVNPTWVQITDSEGDATGERDFGKLLVLSVIISVIIVLLLFLLWSTWSSAY